MFASPARTIGLRARALLVGATIVALTAACSSTPAADPAVPPAPASTTATMPSGDASTAPGLAPPTASASAVAITIKDFAFDVPATVPAGAMVTVTNGDSMTHTVTSSEAGAFDVTVAGGATATFLAPTTPGTYEFVCSFHGNMTGTLVVT
jgi:plastocyanin